MYNLTNLTLIINKNNQLSIHKYKHVDIKFGVRGYYFLKISRSTLISYTTQHFK